MGASVTKLLRWKDPSHLEDGESNEKVLQKLITKLNKFTTENAVIAASATFEGFDFETALMLDSFATDDPMFTIDRNQHRVVSKDRSIPGGKFYYQLRRLTDTVYSVHIGTIKYLCEHLRVAGDRATQEFRRLLEQCRPQLKEVTGVDNDLDTMLLDAIERLGLLFPDLDALPEKENYLQEERHRYQLTLTLGRLDLKELLHALTAPTDESSGHGLKLTLDVATRELNLLKKLAGGREEVDCLKSIAFVSPVASKPNVRVQPRREIQGDLCYIQAETWDMGTVYITVSADGYFINKGAVDGVMDTEAKNDKMYDTVIDLLKTVSPTFGARLEHASLGGDDEDELHRELEKSIPRSLSFIGTGPPSLSSAPGQFNRNAKSPDVQSSPIGLAVRRLNRSMSTLSLRSATPSGKASPVLTSSPAPISPGVGPRYGSPLNSSDKLSPLPGHAVRGDSLHVPNTSLDMSMDDGQSVLSTATTKSTESRRSRTRGASEGPSRTKRWSALDKEVVQSQRDAAFLDRERSKSPIPRLSTESMTRSRTGSKMEASPVMIQALHNRGRVGGNRSQFNSSPDRVPSEASLSVPPPPAVVPSPPQTGKSIRDRLGKLGDRFSGRTKKEDEAAGFESLNSNASALSRRSGMTTSSVRSKLNSVGAFQRRRSMRDLESDEDEEEEEMVFEPPTPPSEMTAEHVQIHKLCKLLKGGDPTTTIVALSSLAGFDLSQRKFQLAVRDVGGLEPLVLLLAAEIPKIRIGAAELLRNVTKHPHMQLLFNQLHGIPPLIHMLSSSDTRECAVAAAALTTLATSIRNCQDIRRAGGIKKLLYAMETHFDHPETGAETTRSRISQTGKSPLAARGIKEDAPVSPTPGLKRSLSRIFTSSASDIVGNCSSALWNVSKKPSSKIAIVQAQGIKVLIKLLRSYETDVLTPVVGILHEISMREDIRRLLQKTDMLPRIIEHLQSDHVPLQTQCAYVLYNCCQDVITRTALTGTGALARLVELSKAGDSELVTASTGVLWRAGRTEENVQELTKIDCIPHLVSLLGHKDDTIQMHAAGAIAFLARTTKGRDAIRGAGGVTKLVSLLTATRNDLLANAAHALASCAQDKENAKVLVKNDGVRLLWSLLKSADPTVQAMGALAITPCIDTAVNAEIRSFVGGLPLIVQLLESPDETVQANVCGTIANIAKDEQNISIMSEYGVVRLLSNLVPTKSDNVRRTLAQAIGRCSASGNNRQEFGDRGAIVPLVGMLQSKDPLVHTAVASAMHQLSDDATNSAVLREAGAVQLLVELMNSTDHELQQSAAGAIANIRKWHLLFSEQPKGVSRTILRALAAQRVED